MKQLFTRLKTILYEGNDAVLVRVTDVSGSAPRGVGANMLVIKSGRCCGTIGGGIVEYEAERVALDVLNSGVSQARVFDLANKPSSTLGMVCGGSITVDFRFLDHADPASMELADEELARLSQNGCVYIFGAGHVARELAPILARVDFSCAVLDDRAEYADASYFPDVDRVILCDFADFGGAIDITERDYLVIMTRGHAFDAEVQAQAMRTNARYIGVMGSASKKAFVKAKLLGLGFSEDDIARVKTPIGLDINSDTPAEIAVSIAAELIVVRASGKQRDA